MSEKLIAYDSMTGRWINESSPNAPKIDYVSRVFSSGYDDPTYMTFRIEFGIWGASNKSLDDIKNTLLYNAPDSLKVHTFNYSEYPCGLLDLNFIKDETFKDRPYYAFNEQVTYNAYNWLMQRNEDVRAQYIKTFVEGLYEIQSLYPYIFLEISGLDALNQFEPNRGFRLKDVEITIKCIEGLQQKIRTLLECYMRGAWDAEWQRWALPENMRQFNMYIYVFERRVFHGNIEFEKAANASKSNEEQKKQNLGSQIVNFLLTSAGNSSTTMQKVTTDAMVIGELKSLNCNLPVAVYECNLCEFNMNNTFGDIVSANWNTTEAFGSTIKIKVKNVRTYYKNSLLSETSPLNNIIIGDLLSAAQRMQIDSPLNAPLLNFINRGVIYKNDILESRNAFGGGGNTTSVTTYENKASWDNMVNSWRNIFGGKNDPSDEKATPVLPETYLARVKQKMDQDTKDIVDSHFNGNWWHSASVQSNNAYFNNGSIWSKIWKVIKAGTQQIRISEGYANAQSDVFYNILDYIDYSNTLCEQYYSYATRAHEFEKAQRDKLTYNMREHEYSWEYNSDSTFDDTLTYDDKRHRTSNMNKNDGLKDTVTIDDQQMETLQDKSAKKPFYNSDDKDTTIGDKQMEFEELQDTDNINIPIEVDTELQKDTEINSAMEAEIEFNDYVHPNDTLDAVSDGAQLNDIDMVSYNRDDIKYHTVDITSGRIDVKDNDEIVSLIEIEGGYETVDQISENSVILDKDELYKSLTTGNSMPSLEFTQIDAAFTASENMITNLLSESSIIIEQEVTDDLNTIGNTDDLQTIAAELAAEDNTLKEQYTEHIDNLLTALEADTLAVAEALPEIEVVGFENDNDADKALTEVPTEALKRFETNLALYSIPRPELSAWSYQSLVSLEKATESALIDTNAMLTAITLD